MILVGLVECLDQDLDGLAEPGSSGNEHHATSNHGGSGLFYLFSTSYTGLKAGQAYTKFAVYGVLNWAGDFPKAAMKLAQEGYGY